jgi:hypothetical protein
MIHPHRGSHYVIADQLASITTLDEEILRYCKRNGMMIFDNEGRPTTPQKLAGKTQ